MMRSIASKIWMMAAVPLFLAACGGGGGGGGAPPVGPPITPPPTSTPSIAVSQVFTSLPAFTSPTVLKQAPGDDTRWFVGEKRGIIRVFANNPSSSSASDFLDMSVLTNQSGEGGLLGVAFHPDFPVTPELFVSYTRSGAPLESHVSRFLSTDGGQTLVAASEEIIFTVLQPETNHNGGDIAFGPDGYLYASFGDGGGGGDPLEYGQDDTNLHGTIVRIDVDGAAPYEIPPDNPNVGNGVCTQGFGGAACPEIFAWGLRNPWRISFDRGTGRLWTGDVGQGAWEEIDVIVNDGNYGWDEREGAHCFEPPSGCATTFIEPVAEYGRSLGASVTGGYVYRGAAITDLVGWYVYGDFVSGRIFATPEDTMPTVTSEELLDTPNSIVAFAEDVNGELYFVDYSLGTVHRIDDAP